MPEQQKQQTKQVAVRNDIGDSVIARINELANNGLVMPKDFSATMAIKMTMIKLSELKDKSGKSALEVCTKESVASALFKMCLQGLNCGLNQAYTIVRGNQLCIDPSYFGKVLMVKRIFPNWNPKAHVVREGDEFEFEIDKDSGLTKLVKHKTKLENIDKDFVGAYIYMPTASGELDLYVMTAKQIRAAWAKSSSTTQATHKAFDQKMISKTIINSACNMIINSTPSIYSGDDSQDSNNVVDADYEVFEEPDNGNDKPSPQTQIQQPKEEAPAQQPQKPEAAPANGEVPFPQNDDDF
jgi:recombination protein RecT